MNNFGEKVSFIWSVAELLRGPYRPNQYKDIMLPMTVLRRLDCVLEPTKEEVLKKFDSLQGGKVKNLEPILDRVAGQSFHNTSKFTFEKLKGDPNNIAANLTNYIKGFSTKAREIFDYFGFEEHIGKLDKADRLYLIVSKFCEIDLNPKAVDNIEMGYIFEELVRRFNEASNEEAGDHFTPREVIRLMVNLIFLPDSDILTTKGIVKTLFDPTVGTGGMLSVSEDYVRELNPDARLEVFGQDYNEQAYAICGSDMMIKGQSLENIRFGDSFTDDHFKGKKFDYMLANPPFGVEWKPQYDFIKKEHNEQGFGGRFGAGLPRKGDGSLLFLQHMISKMKSPEEGGTRLAIVFDGSPLFTGSAGSGESEIQRWIIENDWLEAIVAMPDQLFYNTGIYTYLWIVTNRKEEHRRGKVQLLDGSAFFKKMRKSLGNKRNEICEDQRDEITRLYGDFKDGEYVRIFDNSDFGYQRITVERSLRLNFAVTEERLVRLQETTAFQDLATSKKRKDKMIIEDEIDEGQRLQNMILKALTTLSSQGLVKNRDKFSDQMKVAFRNVGLKVSGPFFKATLMALAERDETAEICMDIKGNPEPDPELRDYENVPLKEQVDKYMEREVLPHVSDAWVDEEKTKIGYEINFNRHFYKYTSPRSLEAIEEDLQQIEKDLTELLKEKRNGFISRSVIKGLETNVPMKNAEIKWLEKIPKNWEVKKLKFVVSFYGGGTPSKGNDDYWTGDIPWVSPKDMKSEIVEDTEDHITEEAVAESSTRVIQPDAVLLVVRSGILRHTIPVAINIRPVAINQDMKALVPKKVLNSSYLKYFIIGLQKIFLVEWRKEGATVESIEFELLANTTIPFPSIIEQKNITLFLDRELEKIDSLISKSNLAVEKLREYRTALISAAVTGKIDVRHMGA